MAALSTLAAIGIGSAIGIVGGVSQAKRDNARDRADAATLAVPAAPPPPDLKSITDDAMARMTASSKGFTARSGQRRRNGTLLSPTTLGDPAAATTQRQTLLGS